MSDDELPQLSAETFAALQEFYQEEEQRETIKMTLEESTDVDMNSFNEDWNLSQFWYDDETSKKLAEICVKAAGEKGKIACISAPSAFVAIRKHFPNAQGKIFATLGSI